ncbi:MAG TPA: aldo/keto reductase [Micavibrio sp.]|nr:aldo/keto reductase [Micavibrio sp.]
MIPLAIGTAQFGQAYGVCNKDGPVEGGIAQDIVDLAMQSGVYFFDTARLYGDSELVLGAVLPSGDAPFIITKISAEPDHPDKLLKDCEDSLRRLNRESVHAVLIHNVQSLLGAGGRGIWDALEALRERNLTDKIGVSVYTPEEFIIVADRFTPDIVQVPCNLLDQRFLRADVQKVKKEKKIEFYARSLFLQGILINLPETLPDFMKDNHACFADIEKAVMAQKATGMEICLSFARDFAQKELVDRWVVGVDSPAQLKEILQAANGDKELSIKNWECFKTESLDIIDPRNWKRGSA